jgi:hypothetical protein
LRKKRHRYGGDWLRDRRDPADRIRLDLGARRRIEELIVATSSYP